METALEKIYRFYHEKGLKPYNTRHECLRTLLKLFCEVLDIGPPEVYMCGITRQNDCIRKKGGVPCGGGCYVSEKEIIYIRKMFGGYDTLLHELFHHVHYHNGNKQIREIMSAWTVQELGITRGYGELLRTHGIPMRKPK